MMAGYDGYGIPRLDFGGLAQIPQQRRQAQAFDDQQRLQANRERTLADLAQGVPIEDVSRRLFAAGDVEGGLSLARLADAQAMRAYTIKKDERDFGFQQTEAQRAQRNADRQYTATVEGGRVPPGFQKTEAGLQPVPGGPQDPAYLERAAGAKAKPRDFSVSDITKLSEEGGKFRDSTRFSETFQDRFAGYRVPALGDAAMFVGRHLPKDVVGKDTAEAAGWWQQYDKYKNLVRNELYGASLQPSEQQLFEKSDVSPGMDPAQIRENLKTQKELVQNGLKRKANALIQSGFDPAPIAAAFGLDLKELGVTATGRGRPGASQPSPAAPPAVSPAPDRSATGAPPPGAVEALRRDPRLAEQFDAKYGVGASASVLGAMR